MATHAPTRQPFGELNHARLQQLASAKNRQIGSLIAKSSPLAGKNVVSTGKRSFSSSSLDDDAENMDPAILNSPSKKTKGSVFDTPTKPFNFILTPTKAVLPSSIPSPRLDTIISPRAPMTAPAGRSPKRKLLAFSKIRRTSAPFRRIDPPFASRSTSSLPFSLDAALSGTLATSKKDLGGTIQELMPSKWSFDIYEDTPDEEAANLMEHSTLTLDLSSDEESNRQCKDDRGKENTPPEGYDAPAASRASSSPQPVSAEQSSAKPNKKTEFVRRKLNVDEMDDGERSPLSDLEADPFFPADLTKDSHILIGAEASTDVDHESTTPVKADNAEALESSTSFQTPPESNTSAPDATHMPNMTESSHGDVVIFEDANAAVAIDADLS